MAKIIQLSPGEEPSSTSGWVLVKVVDQTGGQILFEGRNATFHTTTAGLAFALTEASKFADTNGIEVVYVRLP